jgi:Holliday junction resolvase RusA-like endonuclease
MKFTIYGNPVTKKNHGIIRMIHNHPIMLPSKPYLEYEKQSKQYIPKLSSPINTPINLKCTYYMQTKRKCDLVNLLQATCDILVKYKVLEDDNYSIIYSFDGSSVSYDKDNPRVEIDITKRDFN